MMIVALLFIISALILYILDLETLLKRIEQNPVGYICNDDYLYELDPKVGPSESKVYNTILSAQKGMGDVHVRQSGIAKVRIVKLADAVKGGEYRKEDLND
jgi:hypothetical protein